MIVLTGQAPAISSRGFLINGPFSNHDSSKGTARRVGRVWLNNDRHEASGTFNIGTGSTFDEKNGKALKAGGFLHMPKGMQHFAWFTEETIIQVHGMGPQGITYVNPADDPRKSN